MGQERLTGVAVINIHYDTIISTDEILDKFAKKHPRRLCNGCCCRPNDKLRYFTHVDKLFHKGLCTSECVA